MKYILTLLFFCACTKHSVKTLAATPRIQDLLDIRAGWLAQLDADADPATGWFSSSDCDETLWMGEAAAAGYSARLDLAEYTPGEIHRRPKAYGECYPEHSVSTVSNDMLVGYVLGMYFTKNVDALVRLETYGESHNWVMGQPTNESRVLYSPSGQGLLARAAHAIGGPYKSYSTISEPCLPVTSDFEYHLQALGLYIDGDSFGSLSDMCIGTLKANANRFSADALMSAMAGLYTGDQSRTLDMLLDPNYACPSYVRPVPAYCVVHKLMAAKIVLKQFGVMH